MSYEIYCDGTLVLNLRQHHQEVEIAIRPRFAPRARTKENNAQRIKPECNKVDSLR